MMFMNTHPMLGIPPDTIWCYSMMEHEMWHFLVCTSLFETGDNAENVWLSDEEKGWFMSLD